MALNEVAATAAWGVERPVATVIEHEEVAAIAAAAEVKVSAALAVPPLANAAVKVVAVD